MYEPLREQRRSDCANSRVVNTKIAIVAIEMDFMIRSNVERALAHGRQLEDGKFVLEHLDFDGGSFDRGPRELPAKVEEGPHLVVDTVNQDRGHAAVVVAG